MWNKKEEVVLFFNFITKKNYESLAYPTLSLLESEIKVVRKATMVRTSLWPSNIHNNIVFFCNVDDVVIINV